MDTFICSKCGGSFEGAHRGYCPSCLREYMKSHRTSPEKAAESRRKYREAHPDRVAESTSRFFKRHPEKVDEYYSKFKETHPGYSKEYYLANKERIDEQMLGFSERVSNIVNSKANNKGDYWTVADLEFLESNKGSMSIKDMALHLGRTYRGVTTKLNLLGLGDLDSLRSNFLSPGGTLQIE